MNDDDHSILPGTLETFDTGEVYLIVNVERYDNVREQRFRTFELTRSGLRRYDRTGEILLPTCNRRQP